MTHKTRLIEDTMSPKRKISTKINLQNKAIVKAEVHILLIVNDEISMQRYLNALADTEAQIFVASSFFHFNESIINQTYHGLFIDVLTKMEAIKENKAEVYRLTERFPVAHLKVDQRTGNVCCFYGGNLPGHKIKDFVYALCRTSPQKIRATTRKELYMQVEIFRSAESKRPERTVTKDISLNGCFLISTRHRKKGDEVILHFPDLTDKTRVIAKIRKVVNWGEGLQLPGIGVEFEKLSPVQIIELTEYLTRSS